MTASLEQPHHLDSILALLLLARGRKNLQVDHVEPHQPERKAGEDPSENDEDSSKAELEVEV